MSDIRYPWQQAVMDAFLAHPEDLAAKINVAECRILARLQQSQEISLEEKLALDDALRALQVLISELRAIRSENAAGQQKTEDLG